MDGFTEYTDQWCLGYQYHSKGLASVWICKGLFNGIEKTFYEVIYPENNMHEYWSRIPKIDVLNPPRIKNDK